MGDLESTIASLGKVTDAKIPTKVTGGGLTITNDMNKIGQSIAQGAYTMAYALQSEVPLLKLQKSVETSVRRRAFPFINNMALRSPRTFWHLYEPNHVGESRYALFTFDVQQVAGRAASFNMGIRLKPSTMTTPLTAAQKTPGETGKVVQQRHRFYNKAMVFEYGLPTVIRPISGSAMAFDMPVDNLIFRGPNGTAGGLFTIKIDHSRMPNRNALRNSVDLFFESVGATVVQGVAKRWAENTAVAAGRAATVNLTASSGSDARARSVAKAAADALTVVIE